MEQKGNNTRTRINFKTLANGKIQPDITAEYDTPELTAEMLSKAIDLARNVMREKGLVEAQPTDK